MKTFIRWLVLWAAPELNPIINRVEPDYDPAALDQIARENGA